MVKGLSTAAQPTTAELYVDCNALHGIRPVNKATYGTTYISENATYIYLATRIATYFQAVISPTHIDMGLSDTQFMNAKITGMAATLPITMLHPILLATSKLTLNFETHK